MTVKLHPMPSEQQTQNPQVGGPEMGEVRVQAKLTNAMDAALAKRGRLPADQVRTYVADAVVDTGAVTSTIPQFVFDKLGLEVRGQKRAEYANSSSEIVDVAETIYIELAGREASDDPMVLGDEVLIGQTILEKTDLLVDCTRQRVIGNPAHPDQPTLKVKSFKIR